MEMLDKFLYSFFEKLDNAIAFVETYVIKMTECPQGAALVLNAKNELSGIVTEGDRK